MQQFFRSGVAFVVVVLLCFAAGLKAAHNTVFLSLGGLWLIVATVFMSLGGFWLIVAIVVRRRYGKPPAGAST